MRVRPLTVARLVIRPGSRCTSAWSPGRSMVVRAVPACGTGSVKAPRPGVNDSGAPHSSVNEKGPGPGSSAACVPPSDASGSGRPAAVPSISVAPSTRLTRLTPSRSTSPASAKVPRTESRSTRTRRSALESTAATGGPGAGRGGRLARSTRRLYSGSGSVTVRGCCALSGAASISPSSAAPDDCNAVIAHRLPTRGCSCVSPRDRPPGRRIPP